MPTPARTRNKTPFGLGSSPSPTLSASQVHQVEVASSRKVGSVQAATSPASPASRVSALSLSMDSLLHHRKDKKKASEDGSHATKEKRMSLSLMHSSKTRAESNASSGIPPPRAGKFDMLIESPPLVFYGGASNSTGALLSGRLKLTVEDPSGEVTVGQFTMMLRLAVNTSKPVGRDCNECRDRYETINEWTFLADPKTFAKDHDHQFPFSYLLKGHLPATTTSTLGTIKYQLVALAVTSHGEKIELIHPLSVQRAVPPGPDKSSIRIFPPTNLTGRAILSPVVHPIGTFPVQLTLSGVVEKKNEAQNRWRLRKMMWRIEEHTTMLSVPCPRHSGKVGDGKAMQHSDTKTMGHGEMKSGWKTDFDTVGGEIALEFDAAVSTKISHKPVCDVDASGLTVRHNLVVELIVAEEIVPKKNPNLITPTGAARILRMQFGVVVTERAGMGISWDEEMPPMYEDVPPSPPGYGSSDKNDGAFGGAIMEDYNGPELEYTELERIRSDNPSDPPMYRERDPASLNHGLPMRESSRPLSGYDDSVIAGPSSRPGRAGVTLDDLEAEPPQYGLRRREASDASRRSMEEDFGEGQTGNG